MLIGLRVLEMPVLLLTSGCVLVLVLAVLRVGSRILGGLSLAVRGH